jgi:hypothetical protein
MPLAEKITIFTKEKALEYDSRDADWVISDNWVEVRRGNKTYLVPIYVIDLIVLTFPKEKEKETKTQEGQ